MGLSSIRTTQTRYGVSAAKTTERGTKKMVKFLFVGDLHLRGTNPRNRIDDYKEVAKQKLKEVFKIAVDNAVDAILQPGDIFDGRKLV